MQLLGECCLRRRSPGIRGQAIFAVLKQCWILRSTTFDGRLRADATAHQFCCQRTSLVFEYKDLHQRCDKSLRLRMRWKRGPWENCFRAAKESHKSKA